MQDKLQIAFIQTDLVWQDANQNRENISRKIKSINDTVDIIILPEMFTTGFSMKPQDLAESMNGKTINWMLQLAEETNSAVCGSIIILEDDKFYNRFVFAKPEGKIDIYNKRHTFTLAGEDKVYFAGEKRVIIEYKGWKICPQVCYDLRFPVWSRNTENYDLLIYVANWPKPRINAWDALLQARSIENMTYCVGVNRVGKDINGHDYTGHSIVYNGLGEALTEIKEHEQMEIVELNKNHLTTIRTKLKFLDDRDKFILK